MASKKILFIVPHRMDRSPGQRFRFEQYLPYLKKNGYSITYSNIISRHDDRIFYSKGQYFGKIFIVIKSFFKRFYDLLRAPFYDVLFIYREAHMLGTVFFEHLLKLTRRPIIFDFDDAIWLNDVSDGNKNLSWLKRPSKTGKLISLSDMVFAGNRYLANYALKYSPNVRIIPTTIDTNYHKRSKPLYGRNPICIGWTGTATTIKHFQTALPYLITLKKKYNNFIRFKVIVDIPFEVPELEIVATPWNFSTEIADLEEFDIGIMPLPDDQWSKGKCGFKGLQYMALEIPTIMSPVGVNTEIITDGRNGFLAALPEEWIEKLSLLIENEKLRNQFGKNGRKTVVDHYSVESCKERYLGYLNELSRK